MTGVEERPEGRPVIRTFVGKRPGRYRAQGDVSGEAMPTVRDGGVVRVSVGQGLWPQDIPRTVAFAQSVRNAARVEILGDSRRAVEHARRVFLAAWGMDLPASAESGGVGAWAALMLAQTRDGGKGAER
ncbi:hypothetical protein ACH47Z_18145 [Streptomyces sp. NPDC020192]|uniref:hypothetical protein n=1 Tax=Streptomyces sp. NPDC020192 TaxID=3365066 RepID=UPI0037889B0B